MRIPAVPARNVCDSCGKEFKHLDSKYVVEVTIRFEPRSDKWMPFSVEWCPTCHSKKRPRITDLFTTEVDM